LVSRCKDKHNPSNHQIFLLLFEKTGAEALHFCTRILSDATAEAAAGETATAASP
jgi:hypothetical protein